MTAYTNLLPHQQRVVEEYDELYVKTNKLGVFFGDPTFITLSSVDQDLLKKQWDCMQQYLSILEKRMARF